MTTKGRANSTRRMRRTDISAIETGLDTLHEDTRVLGRAAKEQPDASLFFMDAAGVPRASLRKVAVRGKLDEVLEPSSRVPAVVSGSRAAAGSADAARVARLAKALMTAEKRPIQPASADLWGESDNTEASRKRPARHRLALPHAGSAYIPAPDARAALLAAAAEAKERDAQRDAEVSARTPAAPVLGALFRRATDVEQLLREDTAGPAGSEDAAIRTGANAASPPIADPQAQRKKTRKDRNREKRERAAALQARRAESERALLDQIDAVRPEDVPSAAQDAAPKPRAQRRCATEAIAVPAEVAESMRTLRPAGAQYVADRVLSLKPRGLVSPPPLPRKSRFAY